MAVDEYAAGFDLLAERPGFVEVGGVDAGAEPEGVVVGQAHGVGGIAGVENAHGGAEHFFAVHAAGGGDVVEHGGGVEGGVGFVGQLAAEQEFGAVFERVLHLFMHLQLQVFAVQRGEGGVGVERAAGGEAAAVFEEEAGEFGGDAFGEDDAFAGITGLAGIAEAGVAGVGGGLGDVGIV